MRQILLGLIMVSVLTSCSEKENLTIDQELRNLCDPSQIFTIAKNKTDTIETRNGIKIIIRPSTLVFNDGQAPDDSVQIELREVFDKSDMILNGLGTVSDGRLLESFGMIYLRATSADKELKIRDGSSIAVVVPNKREGIAGELFYGTQADSLMNWKYAGAKRDTTVVVEKITQMSGDLTSIKRTTYKYDNGLRELVTDTVYTVNFECCGDSVASGETYAIPKLYNYEITKLGWINCDRFIDVVDKVKLEIDLKNFRQPMGYLVFRDINSVMQVLFNAKGKAIVSNLPKDYQVDLIIIDKIEDHLMGVQQKLIIGRENILTLETSKLTADELKDKLKELDK